MNKVFIAASLDGYIADRDGSVDFLYSYPDTPGEDMGYIDLISSVDAILMGRNTFETVLGFGVEWPYTKPVFVWTSRLKAIPADLEGKFQLIHGDPGNIVMTLVEAGHKNLYIDGGRTIQAFLSNDLIDEMIITTIPVLLGSGIPLFGEISKRLYFTCTETRIFTQGISQSRFKRIREKDIG